ncbi:uncharacterized protein LOC110841474 isoform X2 [Zootermopsis nevadensis]|uniref:uncharacterized protein LOC110841474 isoform X2 n=1 Tax=Zootermopsis nevadensis TaxID=136037 RepID=UPI000B8E4D10|nr:uncharacterized protein LOC110841474 isoform X2 [Zootermopsis nevadensis]
MEEYDRNRRRSKTFSEMMEERNSRGRKSSLVLYKDDDANDLSDLGIGASDKSLISEDYEHNEKEETDRKLHVNQNGKQGKNGHHDDDASSAATVSSPEPEEYTYERAIQGYVNFAEARVKSRTAVTRTNLNSSIEQLEKSHILESSPEKMSNGHHTKGLPSPPHTPRRQSGAKIEEKLSALEKRRHSSTELNSNTVNGKKMPMVKGDVLKRREMFERACELSEQVSKPGRRLLEGNQDSLSHSTNKDKEKVMLKSSENINGKDSAQLRHRFSNGDLSSTSSVQKRLSQLENKGENEQMSGNLSQSVKERLSNLDSAYNKDGHMNSTAEKDPSLQAKLTNLHSTEEKAFNGIDSIKDPGVGSVRSSSPEEDVIYETKRQQFHRSLDSLDVEGSTDVCNDAFERVQSLEDLDCCRHARNYPASASSTEMLVFSSQSGDTDRDDSGIHTADVSCSVSQADEPVDDGEIITTINSVVPHLETSSSGVDIYHLEVEIVNQKHLGSQRADQKSPVSDPSHNFAADPTEMTTAFLDVKGNLGSLAPVVAKVGVQQVLDSKGNSVSPQPDAQVSSPPSTSLMVEENYNSVDAEVPQCSERADASITSLECCSLVMEIPLGHSNTINEFSCVGSENTADFSNTLTNVAELVNNSLDSKNQCYIQNDNAALTCLQTVLPELSEQTYGVVETDNNDSSIPLIKSETTEQFPEHLPVEDASTTNVARMRNEDPIPFQKKVLVADKRKTVVEVCEKIIIDGGGTNGAVKSPPPTPYIEVPNSRVIPFQEPEQFKQEIMLLNYMAGCEEHDVYNEKCDAQHKLEDVNIPNVNVENVKQEGNSALKSCSNVKQLPSSESFTQNVPSDVKEEEKSSVLGSLPRNCDEDVFLPITTIQIPPLNLSSDVEIVSELAFPLGPPTSTEPPKEKPPPPPTELSDDEVPPVTSLKRLDSTKRIKKEMWRKRSDFLGIEGGNDDSYLEPELKVAPPPDMTTFLVEERRSEQQLYRQSICSETDSNHGETTDSRDSGVELERAHSDDWLGKLSLTPDVLSAQHSRQNSDIYGTASITSEEDEIMKKEREIIEILEKEEQWQYRNIKTSEEKDIGEKLTVKLHQLEQEKMRLEWERLEEEEKRQMKENACREEDLRLRAKEQELKQQEEALRAERERLQRESEELQRQKETLQLRESQQLRHNLSQMQQHWGSTTALPHQQWGTETTGLPPTHLSLQDISMAPTGNINSYHPPTSPMAQSSAPLNYRLSLPDLQHEEQLQSQQLLIRPGSMMPAPTRRPPPPIPPAKPLRAVSQEQKERENSIRNSRMPSADSIPQNVDSTNVHNSSVPAHTGAQPISRQTLQALSAVPRSRFISNDMWMQAKKKPENQRSGGRESTYNYQHWLIQEAEHRRITEQQQRTAVSPRKPSPPHSQPHTPLWNTPQPQPRQEKPLPDAIIQTLTQRVQNRVGMLDNKSSVSGRRRLEDTSSRESQSQAPAAGHMPNNGSTPSSNSAVTCGDSQEKMLSVSGKKKCSHCGEELGRGAAMIIESLRLFYHIDCFKCCVCHVQLGDGLMGTDVRVRNNKLHCHNCYSSDDGVKFSCV